MAQVLKPPTELENLQQDMMQIRELVHDAKRQIDGMLLALAFSFLGGIGMNAAFSAASGQAFTRTLLFFFGCVPLAVATGIWLKAK